MWAGRRARTIIGRGPGCKPSLTPALETGEAADPVDRSGEIPLMPPVIPLLDLKDAGLDELARRLPERVRALSAAGRRFSTTPGLAFMEWRSRRWLLRNETPYRSEIDAIAAIPGAFGVHALNVSTEWACTTAVANGRLIRTLDWPLQGLGQEVVVARLDSPAGAWYSVTWPGFVGALTGMAPGRFAAAYNQAPIRAVTGLRPLDWLVERVKVDGKTAIPAVHLLRRVFETCADFDAALAMLKSTPIAMTGLFSLTGADGRAAIIERAETEAFVHPGNGAVPNQWLTGEWKGAPRGVDSPGRLRQACRLLPGLSDLGPDFAWLEYPMLNHFSRLAVIADPARGDLAAVGLERAGKIAKPVTEPLFLKGLR